MIRGRSINSIAVASIYMACRQCGVVRSLGEVAKAADISNKEAARNYRFLFNELNPKVPLTSPSSHISKIVNILNLNGETEYVAAEVLKKASDMRLTVGRSPSGMAAACLYVSTILTGNRVTQSEIAREAMVTEVTIRNRYKELSRNLDFTVSL
jgi:transcription initiation factor TFIIB